MEKEKTFNYYYDEEKNIIYVPRNILELSRKNNIVIEGTPKIIDDGNYYSIHYKDNNIVNLISKLFQLDLIIDNVDYLNLSLILLLFQFLLLYYYSYFLLLFGIIPIITYFIIYF